MGRIGLFFLTAETIAFAALSGPKRRSLNCFSQLLPSALDALVRAARCVESGGVHDIGIDGARADRGEPDARRVEFRTQAVGEHVHGGLRRAVGIQRFRRGVRRHRSHIDDVSAGAALDQPLSECPAAVDDTAEVDVQHPLPLFGGRVEELPRLTDARVVDHDVGHTVLGTHLVGEPLDGFGVGHVEHVRVRDTAALDDLGRGVLDARLVDIADDQFGA